MLISIFRLFMINLAYVLVQHIFPDTSRHYFDANLDPNSKIKVATTHSWKKHRRRIICQFDNKHYCRFQLQQIQRVQKSRESILKEMEEAHMSKIDQEKSEKEIEKINFTKEAEETSVVEIEKGCIESFLKVEDILNGLFGFILQRKTKCIENVHMDEEEALNLFSAISRKKTELDFDMDKLRKSLNKITEDIKIKTCWKMNLKGVMAEEASSKIETDGEIKGRNFTKGEEIFGNDYDHKECIESFLKVEDTLNGLFGIAKKETDFLNDLLDDILKRKSQLHSGMDELRAAVIELFEKREEIAGDLRIEIENQKGNKSSDESKQPKRSEINSDFLNTSESEDQMETNKFSLDTKSEQLKKSERNSLGTEDHMEANKFSLDTKSEQLKKSERNISETEDQMIAKFVSPKGNTLSLEEYMYMHTYTSVYTYVYTAELEKEFRKLKYLEESHEDVESKK